MKLKPMEILVIEDDPVICQNIKEALTGEGYNVETSFDGSMGEKMLKKKKYGCVVMDINVPHKNGYELCKEFRQYDTTTPVLLLTAFDELEDKVQGFQSGADDYLTKPFYMKELVLRISSLIKRTPADKPIDETLIFGEIVINQKNKSVKRSNQEIMLTPREYQILLKLVQAKGELVPKKELIREIWGSAFDANTNTIEVYINFLRNKIDKPFSQQVIKTKVGYGYFLEKMA
jgi:DNA-binding response OmpR family regulator